MKFGRTETPELIDFTMPEDHRDTQVVLATNTTKLNSMQLFIAFFLLNNMKNGMIKHLKILNFSPK